MDCRRLAIVMFVWCCLLALTAAPALAHDDPDNKLVEFRRSGVWEIWCLDIGGTGRVECDLNLVINYVPNPSFRGMIPRIYLPDNGGPLVRIDYETQTSFASGYIETDGGARFSLATCRRPCIIEGADAQRLVEQLSSARTAVIHFRDYVIESFDVAIDLDGFAAGLSALRDLQSKHRP